MEVSERHAEMDVKTAYVPGLLSFALKLSTGFFDNPARGLPSLSGSRRRSVSCERPISSSPRRLHAHR